LGTYLYFVISFYDDDFVPHDIGDSRLRTDYIRLESVAESGRQAWILALQPIQGTKLSGRYALTAYSDLDRGRKERDKRFDGWGYTSSRDARGGQVVTLLARLDYKVIDPNIAKTLSWPPAELGNLKFELSRRDSSHADRRGRMIVYAQSGITSLSMPSLYAALENTRASIVIKQKTKEGPMLRWRITPFGVVLPNAEQPDPLVRFDEGDVIFAARNMIVRSTDLPDTDLSLEIVHPGTVVEKAVWQTVLVLSALLVLFLLLASMFVWKVLRPINRMAKHSIKLTHEASTTTAVLPYSAENNEIGTLAKAFNELLARTREQSKREGEIRTRTAEERRRREQDDLRAREAILNTIGHEIRAPLQALLGLHELGTPTRSYVDRMIQAIQYMYGASGPEAGVSAMPLVIQREDVAHFVQELTENAHRLGIDNIQYIGPNAGVFCDVDDSALEAALSHLLNNAHRLRKPHSVIKISVEVVGDIAVIRVANQGEAIPEDKLDAIFDYGVSLKPHPLDGGLGQGLFVARSYIRRMKGEVSAKNVLDGVVFAIHLPLSAAPH
jgi:signal transduction histidine kinase